MENQIIQINLVPNLSTPAVVSVSQYDVGRPLVFKVYDGTSPADLTGVTAVVEGTKRSGLGFSESGTVSDNTVTLNTTLAMTQEDGSIPAEIRFSKTGEDVGTANFILAVEKTPHADGTTDGTQETMADLQTQLNGLDTRVTALEAGGGGSGLTDDVKIALLQIAQKVAYIDEHGQTYYNALYNALYPPADLVSISAVYTQSGTVYESASLNTLKPDLVVTAYYDNDTSAVVTDYTLSGTLVAGTSTITVEYAGFTDTFDVTVTSRYLFNWNFKQSLVDSVSGRTANLRGTNTAPTQTSAGLVFDAATQNVDLGEIALKGKTVEIDVDSFQFAGSTSNHMRFIMCPASTPNFMRGSGPLIFKSGSGWTAYAPTASSGGTSASWSSAWSGIAGNTDAMRNVFNGKTLKLVFASDSNDMTLYIDDVNKGTISTVYTDLFNSLVIGGGYTGWSEGNGDQCYNMTITGVRIYAND